MTIRVLAVCLGNICRSPAAEAAIREALDAHHIDSFVDSAGTAGYHVGDAPDERIQEAGRKLGLHVHGAARKVQVADFDEFDYIFAMDRNNLSDLKRLSASKAGKHQAKLMLFGEFASSGKCPEVPDPYYGTMKDFENVVHLVRDCAKGFVQHVQNEANKGSN
jgi:protein-tyrosine phosphatase